MFQGCTFVDKKAKKKTVDAVDTESIRQIKTFKNSDKNAPNIILNCNIGPAQYKNNGYQLWVME